MKSAFLDFDSLGPADIDATALRATLPGIELYPSSTDSEVDYRIAGCEILLVNKVRLDRRRLLRRLGALRRETTARVDRALRISLGLARI